MTGHRMSLSHESLFFPSLPLILYNIVIHGRNADHFNSSFLQDQISRRRSSMKGYMKSIPATEKGKPPLPSDLPSVPSVPERKSVLFSL